MNMLIYRLAGLIFKPFISRNKKFINTHKGESCYIIGNGASLKYLDLSKYDDRIAIGINLLTIHDDYQKLNIKYHICVEPFFFFPLIKNFYDGRRFQKNILWKIFKKSFFLNKNVILFTSMTNIFSCKFKNVFYLHHFGVKKPSKKHLKIDGEFSFMTGALHAAIGLAIEMGFNEAQLIGCDYLLSPSRSGHFYSLGPPINSDEDILEDSFSELLIEVSDLIELSMITNEGFSNLISCHQVKNQENMEYKENYQIVSEDYLRLLDEAFRKNQLKSAVL